MLASPSSQQVDKDRENNGASMITKVMRIFSYLDDKVITQNLESVTPKILDELDYFSARWNVLHGINMDLGI